MIGESDFWITKWRQTRSANQTFGSQSDDRHDQRIRLLDRKVTTDMISESDFWITKWRQTWSANQTFGSQSDYRHNQRIRLFCFDRMICVLPQHSLLFTVDDELRTNNRLRKYIFATKKCFPDYLSICNIGGTFAEHCQSNTFYCRGIFNLNKFRCSTWDLVVLSRPKDQRPKLPFWVYGECGSMDGWWSRGVEGMGGGCGCGGLLPERKFEPVIFRH